LFAYFIALIIEGESRGAVPSVVLWSFFGLVLSFFRRYVVRKSNKDKGFFEVIASDYYFYNYATISLISFIYTVFQGVLLGCSVNYFIDWLRMMPTSSSDTSSYIPFATAFGCILLIILIRIVLEGYIVLYRAAQDISSLSRSKVHQKD
jgi:hypothetical protein